MPRHPSSFDAPLAPIEIDPAFEDPSWLRDLARSAGPYWSVQRYATNLSEMAALADDGRAGEPPPRNTPPLVVPWFRGDWANEHGERLPGVERLLHHAPFVEAARALFGLPVVEPWLVYVNLNPPVPALDSGHIDVPQFVGFDRSHYPIWLLVTMLKSGLFDDWYIPCATAVSWYYEGDGGGFSYWPHGPDAPPVHRACRNNTALVGDNDRMFHCIGRVGPERIKPLMGLTLDAELLYDGDGWSVRDGGREMGRYMEREVRMSVSWKALVFPDEAARKRAERGEGGLTLAQVVERFLRDLRARGIDATEPEDPLRDEGFIATLNRAYALAPRVR